MTRMRSAASIAERICETTFGDSSQHKEIGAKRNLYDEVLLHIEVLLDCTFSHPQLFYFYPLSIEHTVSFKDGWNAQRERVCKFLNRGGA